MKPLQKVAASLGVGLCALLVAATPSAQGGSIPFNFNPLSDDANNTAVQNYMQGIVSLAHPGGTVAVTGSKAEKEYVGDGHVVGPVSGITVTPETLGTSDSSVHHSGPLDTFLQNQNSDRITITFSFPVSEVSFDYEIFPDGTCSQQNGLCNPSTANWPDFTFKADGVVQFHALGVLPGSSGTFPHSPFSGPSNNELAPQYLGTSGTWLFPGGVHKLEFVDWPVAIGIDNLRVRDVPVPASLALMVAGIGLLFLHRRK